MTLATPTPSAPPVPLLVPPFLVFLSPSVCSQKWRRFGAALYAESGCSLARLELQEGPEKPRWGEAPRRIIRLSDCLRVAEAGGEASSPRDTSPFVLETKERLYLLAAPSAERGDWVQTICFLAFPVRCWGCGKQRGLGERGTDAFCSQGSGCIAAEWTPAWKWVLRRGSVGRFRIGAGGETQPAPQGQRKEVPGLDGKGSRPCMAENELYGSRNTGEGLPGPQVPGVRWRSRGAFLLWFPSHPLGPLAASLLSVFRRGVGPKSQPRTQTCRWDRMAQRDAQAQRDPRNFLRKGWFPGVL